MNPTPIRQGSNRGFNLYARVIAIGKHGDHNALFVEQLSGASAGRKLTILHKEDPNYKGATFDEEGLSVLKIKKNAYIGLQEATYLDKGNEESDPIIEARRATKVGKDFRSDQTLAIASYGQSMGRLSGYLLSPKNGAHAELPASNRNEAIRSMVSDVLPKLSEDQGLMLVLTAGKGDDAKTVHRVVSRFHRENDSTESKLLSLDEFARKVDKFLNDGNLLNFKGSEQVTIDDAFNSEKSLRAAILPSSAIMLTGEKFLDNNKRAINTGIGKVGVAIDVANDDREYPIMQIGGMEMTGLVGFRSKGPNGEQFMGDKVRQQSDDGIMNRLVTQINMFNGLNQDQQQSESKAASPEAGQTTTAGSDVDDMPDPFDFDMMNDEGMDGGPAF